MKTGGRNAFENRQAWLLAVGSYIPSPDREVRIRVDMVPHRRPGQGFGEGAHMEIESVAHVRRAVVGIILLRFKKRTCIFPDADHTLMIKADEIAGAGNQARAHPVVVTLHFVVAIFDVESTRTDGKFRGSHEI